MFEVGDIQALAEATDHSVSFLLLGPQVGLGAGRLEFVLEVLPTTESKDVLKGALALQQPFSHPPCPLKLVSAQAIPLPCWWILTQRSQPGNYSFIPSTEFPQHFANSSTTALISDIKLTVYLNNRVYQVHRLLICLYPSANNRAQRSLERVFKDSHRMNGPQMLSSWPAAPWSALSHTLLWARNLWAAPHPSLPHLNTSPLVGGSSKST